LNRQLKYYFRKGGILQYQFQKPDNLVELIEESIKKHSDLPAYGTKNNNGEYQWITYGEVGKRIDKLRAGMAQYGIGRDDVVGLIANNRTEWPIAAFATYGLEGRFIPMYEKELPQTWEFILKDSCVKLLFVANRTIYEQIEAFRSNLPHLKEMFLIDGEGYETMLDVGKKGAEKPVDAICPSPAQIAVQIYTSGTTGKPKGVLLSHGNFTSNVIAGGKLYPTLLTKHSRSVSILPWAHSFGQTAELYNFLHIGGSVGFAESVQTFANDMLKIKPSFLIAVPRVFNKIHAGIYTKINEKGGVAKKLFDAGLKAAKEKRELQGNTGFLTNFRYKLADRIVFKKIRSLFGGRLQAALTASATMNIEINHFFSDIGIPTYDCYGLTETSPAVTMNCPTANKPGTVGRPIEHVKLSIRKLGNTAEEEGEIVVYGPNVMQGYHNNDEASAEAMTADGGFLTGDCGRIDEDGYLYITGRLKEQYKLENGMYIFPAGIEEDIKLNPLVTNAMIYGEGKPFNICIIVPDFEVLINEVKENKISGDPKTMIDNPEIQDYITEKITQSLTGNYMSYEIPKKFIFQKEEFSLENGMLTQTFKLKRSLVYNKYKGEISKLYDNLATN
jgi:long-chain acyl-CoA synthetase